MSSSKTGSKTIKVFSAAEVFFFSYYAEAVTVDSNLSANHCGLVSDLSAKKHCHGAMDGAIQFGNIIQFGDITKSATTLRAHKSLNTTPAGIASDNYNSNRNPFLSDSTNSQKSWGNTNKFDFKPLLEVIHSAPSDSFENNHPRQSHTKPAGAGVETLGLLTRPNHNARGRNGFPPLGGSVGPSLQSLALKRKNSLDKVREKDSDDSSDE